LYNNTIISDHASAGIDIYANSQAYFFGANKIQRNGGDAGPRSAAIRVDGNSEAFLRGGEVANNTGPGLLVLVNSSVAFPVLLLQQIMEELSRVTILPSWLATSLDPT